MLFYTIIFQEYENKTIFLSTHYHRTTKTPFIIVINLAGDSLHFTFLITVFKYYSYPFLYLYTCVQSWRINV